MERITRRRALAEFGLLTGAAVLSGCAVNPVTGKRELMLMSEEKEIGMGGEAHGQIVAQYGSYADDDMQGWFTDKGKAMSQVTHRKHLPWTFTVLDSPVINAFAVPGGYIYVTRGILGYFNDEAQLAGVLGHELGHVTARHTAARYSKGQLANYGLALGSIVSEEFAQFAQLASLGTTMLFLKFSRDDERQADRLGVEYSSKSGYDATHMSEFFETLERLHPDGGSLPAWQSTHPDPGDRINATRKMALSFQQKNPDAKFSVYRTEYLDRINGIVFGDDPRQGYVKEGVFYHPEMAFEFPVPEGWRVSNMPTEVRMGPEKQDAMLMFTLGPAESPAAASNAFAQQNNVTVQSTMPLTINGMKAYKATGQMPSQDKTIGIASYYIKMEDNVYAFHGLCDPAQLTAKDALFGTTANGFKKITDDSLLNVSPKRIQVRNTSKKQTLKDAFNGFDVPEDEIEKLAVINGLKLDDQIDTGTRIKIVTES